ncbi:M10 family metallopeptidase C-terminal domain-containing protein [Azotobacter beijerinckii]|uniref:Delta-60 repeat domain-containing protein n=1 Tax=Azotobacter beijerinckii TaxID=170623 RepID=A0A1I4G4M0_9GAMM|nr:M10 family metallopeptidase C-terminal domain-containing protein [Azotobacter beijerinckii]SFL25038.1 delta-60 repeat domain-containing protein [Azotobacter beijerinckii]
METPTPSNDAPSPTSRTATGKMLIDIAGHSDLNYDLAPQPDGKILLAGQSYNPVSSNDDFSVARLNADGTLDTSLDSDGKAIVDIGGSNQGRSLTVLPDGKILLSGSSNGDFSVIRLNTDGSLDTSFGSDGKATFDLGRGDYVYSMAMQPDGKILVTGRSDNGSDDNFGVIRLNADGTLDTSFGSDGKAIFELGYSDDQGHSVTVLPDGKILMAGSSYDYSENSTYFDLSVIQLNADGTLDTSFGTGGEATADIDGNDDLGNSLLVQPDGKILVAGRSYNPGYDTEFSVARLNANGSLDASFGSDGKASFALGKGYAQVNSLALQPDGKILLAGQSYNPDNATYDFSVIRLNVDGSLDTGFSGDGKAIFDIAWGNDEGHSLTVQPDGKILVSGYSYNPSGNGYDSSRYDFSVIRLNADGTLDKTFGALPEDLLLTLEGNHDNNDVLIGSDAYERLLGKSGNDVLDGGAGRDSLNGGTGADLFRVSARDDSYRTDSENLSDRILDFDPGEDRIDLSALGFTGLGDGHDGTLAVQENSAGTLTYLKSFEADAEGRRFEIALQGNFAGLLDNSHLIFEPLVLEGTEAGDNLQGSPVAEILVGQGGEDYLDGAGGGDLLDGGAGRDTLSGGTGVDVLRFSARNDSYRTDSEGFSDRILDFDPGQDRIDLSALGFTGLGDGHGGTLAVRVNDAGTRTYLKSFEVDAEGRRFEIVLDGNLANRLDSGNVLFAPEALEGSGSGDTLIGSSLAESLAGRDGDDYLHGGAGADILDGGLGRDTLAGGSGADLFRFSSLEDSYRTDSEGFSDLILDFEAGEDRIDLSALGFSGLGDGHGGTLAVQVNSAGTHTYLKSFEANAEGQRFEIALQGDYVDQLSADAFLFAAAGNSTGQLQIIGATQIEQVS